MYDGETGSNAYDRGNQHQDGLRNESEENPLWKHCQLIHDGEKQSFKMEVVGCFKSCLERQVNEAVRIASSEADHVLNSRSEFHQAPIIRQVVTRGLLGEQGEEEVVARGWRGRGAGARGRGRRGGAPG